MFSALIPNRKTFGVLLLFWAALLPLFGVWLWRDRGISPWDLSVHARLSYQAWDALRHFKIASIYTLSGYYPPLFHLVAAPLTLITSHPDIYGVANWFFLLVLMWAVWLAGRRLAGDAAGLSAAGLLPAYLYITTMCHQPMTDLALTAAVACTLCYLICCPPAGFTKLPHALGLCLAAGMLAKWTFPFYAALPVLYYLAAATRAAGGWRSRALRAGLLKAATWPLLLAGPWYYHGIPVIAGKAPRQLGGQVAAIYGDPPVFSWAGLTLYARQIDWSYTQKPLQALLLAGAVLLAVFACKKMFTTAKERGTAAPEKCGTAAPEKCGTAAPEKCGTAASEKRGTAAPEKCGTAAPGCAPDTARGWSILLLSFFSGYVILSLIANKEPRYIMPLMVVVALVSTHWIGRLGPRACVAAAAGLLLFSYATAANNLFRVVPPDTRDFKVEALADWITAQPRQGGRVRIWVVPNDWHLNGHSLNYALLRRKPKYGATYAKTPLNAQLLQDYRYVILTDPPGEKNNVAPNMPLNTEFMLRQADWKIATTITRDDQVKIVVLERK